MLNPSFKNTSVEEESRYTLVMLVAKRARQLVDGSEPMVETNSHKPVTIAIEELLQDKIEYEKPNINSIK